MKNEKFDIMSKENRALGGAEDWLLAQQGRD